MTLTRQTEESVFVEIGAMAGPLTTQLAGRIEPKVLVQLEKDNAAITRLLLRGYMTEARAQKTRLRLLRNAEKAANNYARAYNARIPINHRNQQSPTNHE